jgi:hypothetical protein
MKLKFTLFAPTLIVTLLGGTGAAAEQPLALFSTALDITRPLADLPTACASSDGAQVAAAIQGRLDYLLLHNLPGRIVIPEGHWSISRPIFMNGDGKELVGAGMGRTVLEAADGFRGMPMINCGARTYYPDRPLQACNRVPLTTSGARVLDASVPGRRWGLRTYAEYPPAGFPAVSRWELGGNRAGKWVEDKAYLAGDVVEIKSVPMPGPLQAACLLPHQSKPENEPLRGRKWKKYWVVKLPFALQCFADPFSAGAYDPALHRAGNWASMRQFTLDFAFTLNTKAAKPYGLCGVERSWALSLRDKGQMEFSLVQADNHHASVVVGQQCSQAGTYRLAVQVDFTAGTIQAWLRKPSEANFTRTCRDIKVVVAGGGFGRNEYSYFTLPYGDEGPCKANRRYPPLDITVCGLHTSAGLRYADSDQFVRRDGGPADDACRYFANDEGTMAFLPLEDDPAVEGAHTAAMLVTVQHGTAAGDAKQKGYGYFKSPASIHGVGAARVSDMTIRPGPTWGVGIVNWNTLCATYRNLDLRGGYWAVGDLYGGAQYVFDVRNCTFSGSDAAWCGMSNILYFKDVRVRPVGRCGLLLSGCNCMLDRMTFADPQTFHSEYYYRHLGTVQYGGMNFLLDITAETPAECRYPSIAAFSQHGLAGLRTSFTLRRCRLSNLPPQAALLDLPAYPHAGPMVLLVEDLVCEGKPLAAMVRAAAPWWNGEVRGYDPRAFVKLLDYRPNLDARPPTPGTNYRKGEAVLLDGQVYECLQDHVFQADLRPGTAAGKTYWQLAVPRIVFQEMGRDFGDTNQY